jgi:hypothetical protein
MEGTIIGVVGPGGGVTVTVAVADFVVSCVDVAITVAVPVVAGVKMPPLLTAPILDGLTDQVTVLLKLPVPVTVGVQVEV